MPLIHIAETSIHYRFDGAEAAPVLLLSNSLGTNLQMWATRAVADAVPKARYAELDDSHLSNIERPERFTAEALGFLCG